MHALKQTYRQWAQQREIAPNSITQKMACALIGHTVDVLANANGIAHGVVSGVLNEAGRPMLVVSGVAYDLSKVLTATPTAFN